jgi:hypothetical protein
LRFDSSLQDPRRCGKFVRKPLCASLAGNAVDLLTITTFGSDAESLRNRKGVVISARVPPLLRPPPSCTPLAPSAPAAGRSIGTL